MFQTMFIRESAFPIQKETVLGWWYKQGYMETPLHMSVKKDGISEPTTDKEKDELLLAGLGEKLVE